MRSHEQAPVEKWAAEVASDEPTWMVTQDARALRTAILELLQLLESKRH
jgi:hypothetical protein